MRGVDHLGAGKRREGIRHARFDGFQKAAIVRKGRQLLDLRRAFNSRPDAVHVLAVLAAPRVRTKGRSRQCQSAPNAVRFHLTHGVLEHGRPVSISPIKGKVDAVCAKLLAKGLQKQAALRIDRAHAAEVIIVLGHFQHPLTRHVSTPQNVFEKGNDIVAAFRTAE